MILQLGDDGIRDKPVPLTCSDKPVTMAAKDGIMVDTAAVGKTHADVASSSTIEVDALDEAEIFLRDNHSTWDGVELLLADQGRYKALVKKIDWNLMPLLMVTYGLQLVDKMSIVYSAVFDLRKSSHLVGSQYAWLGSIFYFGYLFWEWPGSYLAQRFNVGRYVSIVVIIWGVVLMATAAANGFPGLMIGRFLLGCLEAPITPCFMMIVSSWYDRQLQPFRAGLFYCCNGIGLMLGSILFYGVGQIRGFHVYKAIFLISGGITVIWGTVLLWRLPNSVLTAKNYTVEEKLMVIGIGRRNQTGVYNRHIKVSHIKEAFLDPQLWLCFLIMVVNEVVNGGFVTFGVLVVKGIVHDPLRTTALGIPQGAFMTFFIASGTYCATRFKNSRCIVMVAYLVPSIVASFLYLYLPRSMLVGLLFAYYIMSSYCVTLTLILQMPSYNLSGYTKRVTGSAFVFLGYCIGNIIGPQAFLAREAPTYPTGCKVLIACNTVQVGLIALLWLLLTSRNRKRDGARVAVDGVDVAEKKEVMTDLTDFEDKRFRYQY